MNRFRDREFTRGWVIALGFLVVYLPFSWLLFTEWQYIKPWPVFPGMMIAYLIRPLLPESWVPQWTYLLGLAVTALFVTGVILGLLRVRRGFWPLLAGVFALACAFAVVAHLLMKA